MSLTARHYSQDALPYVSGATTCAAAEIGNFASGVMAIPATFKGLKIVWQAGAKGAAAADLYADTGALVSSSVPTGARGKYVAIPAACFGAHVLNARLASAQTSAGELVILLKS